MNHNSQKFKTFAAAEAIAKRYNCATCYGHLNIFDRKDHFEVVCARKDLRQCAAAGFVRKEFVERQRSQSLSDRSEAYWNLADTLGLSRNRSAEQAAEDIAGKGGK